MESRNPVPDRWQHSARLGVNRPVLQRREDIRWFEQAGAGQPHTPEGIEAAKRLLRRLRGGPNLDADAKQALQEYLRSVPPPPRVENPNPRPPPPPRVRTRPVTPAPVREVSGGAPGLGKRR